MTQKDWYSPGEILQKLGLAIKQSLKLLNTLCFSLKDKIMLFAGQGFKITWTVIIRHPIKMVDYPVWGQCLAVSFFPNKDMFTNIALLTGSRVFWLKHIYISICSLKASTFPTWAFVSRLFFHPFAIKCPSTISTSFSLLRDMPTTIQALIFYGLPQAYMFIRPMINPGARFTFQTPTALMPAGRQI